MLAQSSSPELVSFSHLAAGLPLPYLTPREVSRCLAGSWKCVITVSINGLILVDDQKYHHDVQLHCVHIVCYIVCVHIYGRVFTSPVEVICGGTVPLLVLNDIQHYCTWRWHNKK